jgi:uncharacterized membrane protein (UPF0127 family)
MPEENAAVTAWARKHRLTLIFLTLITLSLAAFFLPAQFRDNPGKDELIRINLKGEQLLLQLANTASEQERGLSGQRSLTGNDGMLFVFAQADEHCIWMKDMRFNIDILWFDADRHLIHQVRNAGPESYPESFCPKTASRYVLELRAGHAERLGLKSGDKLELKTL